MAKTKLGLDSLDADYERVSSAAKEVGLSEWYWPTNKFLSKYAHPTAMLVIGIMHQTEKLRDMQSVAVSLTERMRLIGAMWIFKGWFTP